MTVIFHVSSTTAQEHRWRKRSFASIEQLPSKRWRVRYTGPDGADPQAPHTFAARIDAEAFADRGAPQDRQRPVGRHRRRRQAEQVTFGVYAARWLANRQVAGRPIKARTREHYQRDPRRSPAAHVRPPPARRDQAEGRPRLVRGDAGRPADDALARLQPAAHHHRLARSTTRLIDANPARIVGAGRAKRVHKIRPASVEELGVLTAAMPERLRLMVTLASWCALRFGETVELRRGDIDLSDEVIRIRRAAVRTKRHLHDHHTRSPTPVSATSPSRRTSSR